MELITSTPKERFEEVSAELSALCFEAGRMHFSLVLDEEAMDKKRLRLKNMQIDFDKLNDRHTKAFKEFQESQREAATPDGACSGVKRRSRPPFRKSAHSPPE